MISFINQKQKSLWHRLTSSCIALTFILSSVIPPSTAAAQPSPQTILNLPIPGTMINITSGYSPALIRGVITHPENPLDFDFIVSRGNSNLQGEALSEEARKMIKYFLASLTTPEDEMWVNLSPYEGDRIIAQSLGVTEMGRDLLAQDYILKQLTASLMYPEDKLGNEFWNRVHKKAMALYGTTDIPMNTFNKIWIVPDTATVYQSGASAFVLESRLKVMLEEDYVALHANMDNSRFSLDQISEAQSKIISGVTSEVVKEVLIPEIEYEVNHGEHFAKLRQISNAMILATWFKQNLRESLLGKVYVDKNKTQGIDVEDREIKQKIYNQYLDAFKQGVYNYIKEEFDPSSQEIIPRKYFSGGFEGKYLDAVTTYQAGTQLPARVQRMVIDLQESPQADNAMFSTKLLETGERADVTAVKQLDAFASRGPSNLALGQDRLSITRADNAMIASAPEPMDYGRVEKAKKVIGQKTVFLESVGEISLADLIKDRNVKFVESVSGTVPTAQLVDGEIHVFAADESQIHPRLLARLLVNVTVGDYLDTQLNISGTERAKLARRAERTLGAIILGGPDGVILTPDRSRTSSLKRSIARTSVLEVLEAGYDVVIETNQRLEDDDQTGEQGLLTRITNDIPKDLRRNLTIYASSGTIKVSFNDRGQPDYDRSYNQRNAMDTQVVELITAKANQVIERYWADYKSNPARYRNEYPAFVFADGSREFKPQVFRHVVDGDTYSLSILYWPSRESGVGTLSPQRNEQGEFVVQDERAKAEQAIRELIQEVNPLFFQEYTTRQAGVTTIDIRKRLTGKDHAISNYMVENNLRQEDVIFFGNLERYSEDLPVAQVGLENTFINDLQRQRELEQEFGFTHAGYGVASVAWWLGQLGRGTETIQSIAERIRETKDESGIEMAKRAVKVLKNSGKNKSEKTMELRKIYQDYDLNTGSKQSAWTVIYRDLFGSSSVLIDALNLANQYYPRSTSVDDFFEKADGFFEQSADSLDFFEFYAGIDPRAAMNLEVLRNNVYESDQELMDDIKSAAQSRNIPVTRVLTGFFQDRFIHGDKADVTDLDESRAPPVLTYIGGGGKAITTLVNQLVREGIDKVATVVSSSDDGGSSGKVMESLMESLGFFFIPPGDAAGMMIWMSPDDDKIFTLFDTEVDKSLDSKISSFGRITSDALTPEWLKRIQDVYAVTSGKIDVGRRIQRSDDFVAFISGMLTLGRMIDRDLINSGILTLSGMSSANIVLMGAAKDGGYLEPNRPVTDAVSLQTLEQLLGISGQRMVPVSFDYERSALIATYEDGREVLTQTKITDMGHDQFITQLRLAHRVGISQGEIRELDRGAPIRNNPDAVKTIEETTGAILMGNGSLFTSFLPNLLYPDVAQALIDRKAKGLPAVYVAKVKADLETAKGVSAREVSEGEFVLEVEDQQDLMMQLETIRQHVSRTLNREVALNEFISHVVVPDLSQETFDALGQVALSEDEAKTLRTALAEGQAQVSKYVKGVQKFSPADVARYESELDELGVEVIKVDEQYIEGVESKSPLYNNTHLIQLLETTVIGQKFTEIQQANALTDNFIPASEINRTRIQNSSNPQTVRVSFERDGGEFRQVSEITIPGYNPSSSRSVEASARQLVREVYNRLTIFGAVDVKIDANQDLFDKFQEVFSGALDADVEDGKGLSALGDFMNTVYQTDQFNISRVDEGALDNLESTPIEPVADIDTSGSYLGIDVGGSDVKAVIVKDGKLVRSKVVKWSPSTITNPKAEGGHIDTLSKLINGIISEIEPSDGLTREDLQAIGLSVNLAVANNKITGVGPVVQGIEDEGERAIIRVLDNILSQEFEMPVFVLNDGDAAAVQSSVDMGLPKTLSLAGGTGLAMGYGSGELMNEGGNFIIDVNESAARHSFNGVPGAAQQYISQRPIFRLAEQAGIDLSDFDREADKLERIQQLYEDGDKRAEAVYDLLPQYIVEFIQGVGGILDIENVVLFGRITKGQAGRDLLAKTQIELDRTATGVKIHFPQAPEGVDQELYQEVGQAIGATYFAAKKLGDSAMFADPDTRVATTTTADTRSQQGEQTYGGIDLNPALLDLQIKRDGQGVPLPVNQQPIENMNINGFLPVIINVTPVTNLPLLLGLTDDGGNDLAHSTDGDSSGELSIADKIDAFKLEERLEV